MTEVIVRRTDVVTRFEGEEALVLDLQSDTAHCFGGDVARVWRASESATTVAAVVIATGLETDDVMAALESLQELSLVAVTSRGLGRRTLLVRGAAVGGAVVAAGVVSVPLPASARANSANISVASLCQTVAPNTGGYQPTKLTVTIGPGQLQPSTTYTFTVKYYSGNFNGSELETSVFTAKTTSPANSLTNVSSVTNTGQDPGSTQGGSASASTSGGNIVLTYTTGYTFHSGVSLDITSSSDSSDTRTISLTGLTHCVPTARHLANLARACGTGGSSTKGIITFSSPGDTDSTGLMMHATYTITVAWTGGSSTFTAHTANSAGAAFDTVSATSGNTGTGAGSTVGVNSSGVITFTTAAGAWTGGSGPIKVDAYDGVGNHIVADTISSKSC